MGQIGYIPVIYVTLYFLIVMFLSVKSIFVIYIYYDNNNYILYICLYIYLNTYVIIHRYLIVKIC